MRFVWGFAILSLVASCNDNQKTTPHLKALPPDHMQMGCTVDADCDDNDPCTTDLCRADHSCASSATDCSMVDDDCNVGVCDPSAGCVPMPGNEGADCFTNLFDPGTCASGTCQPVPQCQITFDPLACFSSSNTALDSTSGAKNVIDTYTCATQETGPELAYTLSVPSDRKVTLKLTDTSADLDLIVLEGDACLGTATCAARSLTRGSGEESVTFNALASKNYLVVVDGFQGAKGSFTLTVGCDNCKTLKNLDCNMTLSGNTTGATASTFVAGYGCDPLTPGPEDTYHLKPPVDTDYTLKLSGLSQDLDLIVVWNTDGACDPGTCKASQIKSGTTDETVSFTGYDFSDYSVIIDSKGVGGPYQLEVSCKPTCYSPTEFSCATGSDARRNDDPVRSSNSVNSWPCDADTTGREVIYQFNPKKDGDYVFELSGLLADLDLIVVEGPSLSCDPTAACVAQSTNPDLSNETLTVPAKAGHHYYVAVDGKHGAASPYTLKLKSSPCDPWSCSNANTPLDCTWLEDRGRNDDPVKSRNVVDFWGSCDTATNGPEVAYQFKAPKDGTYTVTVDGLDANLDLIVLDGSSTAPLCNPQGSCQAARRAVTVTGEDGGAPLDTDAGTGGDAGVVSIAASESLTFPGTKDKTYWIVVDGRDHAVGSYHIVLSSADCPAAICQDAQDDLACDARRVSGTNDDTHATNDVVAWGACDSDTSGPERAHLFTPTGAGPYKIKLSGQTADLDLIVLTAGAGATPGCDPHGACVASSVNGKTDDESVTFTADPSKKYWIVVDGKNGAVSPYTLTVTNGCP